MNVIIDLLSSSGYVTYNKAIARELGISEAILLGELCSKYKYWFDRGELVQNNGWFYMSQAEIEYETGLSPYQQRAAIAHLKDHGIAQLERRGQPARNWYSIDMEGLNNWMFRNSTSSDKKTEPLEVENFDNINRSTKKETKKETNITPLPPELKEPDLLDGFSSAAKDSINSWLTYKQEKRQGYKPEGLKKLIGQIRNNIAQYGDAAVIEVIEQSMAANYQGIIFDKMKNRPLTAKGKQPANQTYTKSDFLGGEP